MPQNSNVEETLYHMIKKTEKQAVPVKKGFCDEFPLVHV